MVTALKSGNARASFLCIVWKIVFYFIKIMRREKKDLFLSVLKYLMIERPRVIPLRDVSVPPPVKHVA